MSEATTSFETEIPSFENVKWRKTRKDRRCFDSLSPCKLLQAMMMKLVTCTKHFDRLTHYIREAIEHLYVLLTFVRTADQRADIFTKCLDKTTFLRIRNMLFAA